MYGLGKPPMLGSQALNPPGATKSHIGNGPMGRVGPKAGQRWDEPCEMGLGLCIVWVDIIIPHPGRSNGQAAEGGGLGGGCRHGNSLGSNGGCCCCSWHTDVGHGVVGGWGPCEIGGFEVGITFCTTDLLAPAGSNDNVICTPGIAPSPHTGPPPATAPGVLRPTAQDSLAFPDPNNPQSTTHVKS